MQKREKSTTLSPPNSVVELPRRPNDGALSEAMLESVLGGLITDIRANVAGLGGGGLPGTT